MLIEFTLMILLKVINFQINIVHDLIPEYILELINEMHIFLKMENNTYIILKIFTLPKIQLMMLLLNLLPLLLSLLNYFNLIGKDVCQKIEYTSKL